MPVAATRPQIIAEETYPIQNEHRGDSCFTHGGPSSAEQYRWAGKGDPEGGDVQYIPGYVIKSPAFSRVLARGLFSIADQSYDYNAYQGEVWAQAQAEAEATVMGQLEDDDNDTLEQAVCVGPGKRGSGSPCGEQLFVRRKELDASPPLCDRHKKYSEYFEKDAKGDWQRIGKPSV